MQNHIENMNHPDAEVRFTAAQALGNSTDERAVEPLLGALSDANSKVQYAALSGLVKLGVGRAALPVLNVLLQDPANPLWKLLTLDIGMRLRTGLLNMVAPGDTAIADKLIYAFTEDADMFNVHQHALIVRLLGRTTDMRMFDAIIKLLLTADPVLQGAAGEALGYLGDARAVPPLLVAMRTNNGALREIVIFALGMLRAEAAVDGLIRSLQAEDPWTRRAAASALGEIGDKRAMSPLIRCLQDDEELVRDAADAALQTLIAG